MKSNFTKLLLKASQPLKTSMLRKLTEDDCVQIKALYRRTAYNKSNMRELVEKFGCSRSHICHILKGRRSRVGDTLKKADWRKRKKNVAQA